MVTDVVMPGMCGGQLAETLSSSRPEMKVLFVSGPAEKIVRNHRIMEVRSNFLQKPFTRSALGCKIREFFADSRTASAGAS